MNEQELSYGIFLSESQLDFLYNYPQGYNRMKCFMTFLKLAVKEPTHYVKGQFEVDLTPGQFAISEVELAKLLDCNRKTAGKMAVLFHNAGLVTSVSNSFTTIFTIPCLACWYQGDKQFMSKVYSRHHVPSERIPIARKNNKSVSNENVQDLDIANQNESKEQSSTSNDLLQVVTEADNNANQEPKASLPDEPISNDAHVCAKYAQAEGTQTLSSFDGKSDVDDTFSSDNDQRLTHPSVEDAPSAETDNAPGSNSDEVDDTGPLTPDTGISNDSLMEHTSNVNNAPTDKDKGSTATHPDDGEIPPQEG